MAEDLSAYPDEDVRRALKRCRLECKGRFTTADAVDRLPDRPMGADAAWDIAMRARIWDEDATLVVPRAIFQAFPFGIWGEGDKVGARMAFRDAYPAKLAAHGDAIEVSLGLDVRRRIPAVLEAMRTGLIAEPTARRMLPQLTDAEFALGADMDETKKLEAMP